ncbi:MAG TPA: hypothetical protein VF974_02740 [Patescibacteria group bacterium]
MENTKVNLISAELENIEDNIKKNLSEMSSVFQDIIDGEKDADRYKDDDVIGEIFDIIQQNKNNFKYLAEKIFQLGLVYFELKNLILYRSDFIFEVKPSLVDKKKLYESHYSDEMGEEYSPFTSLIWKYFLPFPFCNGNENEQLLKRTGLIYLEHILYETAIILEKRDIIPTKETEVYNGVRVVIEATFPNHASGFSFLKTAKCYKPDILLPSLNCAIEYKYAEDEKELNETMDQILIDVEGYSKHPEYKLFYAVFYTKAGVVAQQRFNVLWDEKEFPKNWKAILVQG